MPHSGWGSRLASREGRPQIGLTSCRRWGSVTLVLSYPLLNVVVSTPIVQLRGATDDLLDQLAPLVREGKTDADPPPYDDPTSLATSRTAPRGIPVGESRNAYGVGD